MKKKLMMVAVLLGALSLGACVDDNESASVTNIRNAKAEQLTALAEKARAEGEAAKILAEAEQAVKEAYAAWLNEQTSQSNQKFAIELEKIKAETEAAILEAQQRAQAAEQAILANANAHLQELYSLYSSELAKLQYARQTKANYEIDKAKLEAGLGTIEEYIQTLTDQKNAEIAQKEAEKAAWENYSGLDKDELQAQLKQLNQQKYTAFAEKQTAQDDANAKKKTADAALEVFSTDYEGTSTVAAVAAIQKYEDLAVWNWRIEEYSYDYTVLEESVREGFIDWSVTDYYQDEYDGKFYYAFKAAQVYYDGQWLFASPTVVEQIALSEDVDYSVAKYALRNEATTTAISQYYENQKNDVEQWLGSPASTDKLATGLYATLETQEATLETAQKTLADAETAYTKAEQDWKKASDALDTAKANETAAKTTYDDAVEATAAAQEALDKANQGTDAAAITAAQNALRAAQTAEANALTAWRNAQTATANAQTALNTAQNTYYTAQTTLSNARTTAQEAEMNVARTNDQIAYYTEQIENWDENAAAWNAMVTAINSDDYATAIEGLKSNTDVAAYIAAALVVEEKTEAYNEINAQVNALAQLINSGDVIDAAEQIAQLDKDIAKLKYDIENLPYDKLENGTLGDSKEYRERLIAYYETAISELEAEIAVQEKIVETYKAAVEDAINNGESTDTPAEDQPAA